MNLRDLIYSYNSNNESNPEDAILSNLHNKVKLINKPEDDTDIDYADYDSDGQIYKKRYLR